MAGRRMRNAKCAEAAGRYSVGMDLRGKAAVVTGGSRGIGLACARALSRAGARVAVCSRSAAGARRAARSIGRGAFGAACDVSSERAVARFAREAARRLGPVGILVNAAGVAPSAPLERTTLAMWSGALSANATGTFLCMRALLPGMRALGEGRIVNIVSTAGLGGGAYIAAYSASKHAAMGLTRSAAAELARSDVAVSAVCPGFVDTEMTRASVARVMERTGKSRKAALAAILASAGQGRLLSPGEVAAAVLRLCRSPGSRANGAIVVLDGKTAHRG